MKFKQLFLIILLANLLYGGDYGRLLLDGNCITCHHETKNISAPSLKIIKKRYKDAFNDKAQFVSYMSKWVKKPNSDTSLMSDMIKKYSLMPDLGFDEDVLRQIATHIYETNY